MQKEAN